MGYLIGNDVNHHRQKRCICGHSKTFPICDGRHRSEGWTCLQIRQSKVPLCFGASTHLQNFAIRLSHRFQGALLDDIGTEHTVRKLVLITDGTDITFLQTEIKRIEAHETLVIGIGLHVELLNWAFPNSRIKFIQDSSLTAMWSALEKAVNTSTEDVVSVLPPPKIFISHAVKDEALIFPALTILRQHYGIPLFVCADSIQVGSKWQEEIEKSLKQCDLFLFFSSQASSDSTYCAFESGVAYALNKPTFVINLDGTDLPGHLSNVQAIDVPRLLMRKPWLRAEDGILEGCLAIIHQQS